MLTPGKRSHISRYARLLLAIFCGCVTWSAAADNRQLRINEILSGLNGDSRVQFIEIVTDDAGQKQWGPQGAETIGRAMLVFHDASGNQTGRFVFANDAPTGGNTVLIATQAFATLSGVTPDFIMPPLVVPLSGKVCMAHNPDNVVFPVNLCVSYGGSAYTGDTEGAGAANPASLAILDGASLSRNSNFNASANQNADFALALPTPASTSGVGSAVDLEQNNLAEVVLPIADFPANQGRTLFLDEAFLGNGRTCGSCHRADEHFGLKPSTVALLPATNPLFVHEQNVNQLVVSSAGSVNPAGNGTQPSDFRIGDTLTGSLGGSATVLAGSAGTYLIVGGASLNISTNLLADSAGNTGTLVTFSAGDLDGPAPNGDPAGLDGPDLRAGRALFVENINGFAEASFRRGSPTLLNIARKEFFGHSADDNLKTLDAFSAGAIAQHFPRSLNRNPGVDFRVPTSAELAAMTAFMETIRMPASGLDADIPKATTEAQKRGGILFNVCRSCHASAVLGAVNSAVSGFSVLNTGVADLPINAAQGIPTEQDVGQPPNSRSFVVPQLIGVAQTGPYFHDNSVATLRDTVEFYRKPEFLNTQPGTPPLPIEVTLNLPGAVDDITAFLEAMVELPFSFTSSLVFPQHAVESGPSGALSVTISNTGTALLSIANAFINGADPGVYTVSTPQPDAGPFGNGVSRQLDVTFDPVAVTTSLATLEIELTDGVRNFRIGVALDGTAAPDSDGDGISDNNDNCISVPNSDQANDDGDSAGNLCDFFPGDPTQVGIGVTHNYVVGLNLVPLGIAGDLVTSIDFASAIETAVAGATVTRILGFDTSTQTFTVHQGPLSFQLTPGQAYFVTISGNGGTLNLFGQPYSTLDIANGLTFLSVEPASTGSLISSADLETKLETQAGNASAITRILGWDAAQQIFRVHQGALNFSLSPLTEGTVIFSNTGFTYTP